MRGTELTSSSGGAVERGSRRATPVAFDAATRESMPSSPDAPVVIKLGGRVLEAPGAPEAIAAELASLDRDLLLVHGGGAEVSSWCDRLGLASRFEQGLRVTDAASLEVATAVLAGLANKRLVAALRAAGLDAVGLSALDGGMLAVVPHPECARLGAVGAVAGADPRLLHVLLAHGFLPVISSIGAAGGGLLNLNADDVAGGLAGALGASVLVLLSDTPGVRIAGAIAPQLAAADIDAAIASGEVTAGMAPKLRAARAALEHGIGRAVIGAWQGPGTLRALVGLGAPTHAVGTTILAAPEAAHG